MSPQAISAIAPASVDAAAMLPPPMPAPVGPIAAADGAAPFGQLVAHGLESVNSDILAAQVDMQKLAAGNAPDLHRVMIHLEETQLSFQLMMQVRGRLLDAYQDVMKMSV